jgi:outer membrane lipoprotein
LPYLSRFLSTISEAAPFNGLWEELQAGYNYATMQSRVLCIGYLAISLLVGCDTGNVIPPSLERQVARVAFPELQASVDSYRGRLVLLGGEVLSAKQLKTGTKIEVLQLPLNFLDEPSGDRTTSQGRFLAVKQGFLDPLTLPTGTKVTIVGEVTGGSTQPLDEMEYTYPMLEIRHLKIWPRIWPF